MHSVIKTPRQGSSTPEHFLLLFFKATHMRILCGAREKRPSLQAQYFRSSACPHFHWQKKPLLHLVRHKQTLHAQIRSSFMLFLTPLLRYVLLLMFCDSGHGVELQCQQGRAGKASGECGGIYRPLAPSTERVIHPPRG